MKIDLTVNELKDLMNFLSTESQNERLNGTTSQEDGSTKTITRDEIKELNKVETYLRKLKGGSTE